MVDVNDLVNEMTSKDFTSGNIDGKVFVAYKYCSNVFGAAIPLDTGVVASTVAGSTFPLVTSDDDHGTAMALLSEAMLIEGRKTVQARRDPNITIRSTDELFTDEMRNMLLIADDTDEEEVAEGVMWSNDLPTEGWDLGP